MPTLFISDLHLGDERPEKVDLFKQLLQGKIREADALYILGDLFEAWAGDDDRTPPHPEIISALAEFTGSGGRLFLMRGNRDYLLGEDFARQTGGELLPDILIIDLYGKKTLLMHGDTLCTRDVKYQIFRKIVNNAFSIRLFLRLPFRCRAMIWHGIRHLTSKSTARKPPDIIDVHQPAVEKIMSRHDVGDLIHGHTHHEGLHEFKLKDGTTVRRYVLGDWYVKDSVLVADRDCLRLMRVEEYIRDQGRVMSNE